MTLNVKVSSIQNSDNEVVIKEIVQNQSTRHKLQILENSQHILIEITDDKVL